MKANLSSHEFPDPRRKLGLIGRADSKQIEKKNQHVFSKMMRAEDIDRETQSGKGWRIQGFVILFQTSNFVFITRL